MNDDLSDDDTTPPSDTEPTAESSKEPGGKPPWLQETLEKADRHGETERREGRDAGESGQETK